MIFTTNKLALSVLNILAQVFQLNITSTRTSNLKNMDDLVFLRELILTPESNCFPSVSTAYFHTSEWKNSSIV